MCEKKTLDLYAAVKGGLKNEMYVDDLGDRRGASLKFRFRTRSAGLRGEVGGWKNRDEDRQCIMCSMQEDENVEHVLFKCKAYRSEREQLWREVVGTEDIEWWSRLGEEEKVRVLLGGETDTTDEAGRIDRGVKKYLRKVMDKRRRWMGQGNGL